MKILSAETNLGSATNVSNAPVVRLFNSGTDNILVTRKDYNAVVVGSFIVPAGQVVYCEKYFTDTLEGSADVKATKVAYSSMMSFASSGSSGSSGIDCEGLPSGRYIDFSARKTLNVSSRETYPTGVYVGNSGTKLYTVGQSGDGVDEWTLSTAYDPTSATHTRFKSTVGDDFAPDDLYFKDDGTKFFIVGNAWDKIYEYHLSTAWDISTASYDSNYVLGTNSSVVYPTGLTFSPDGVYMFLLATGSGYVNRWTLSTPWDISTAGSKTQSNFASAKLGTNQSGGLAFNPSGTRLALVTSNFDQLFEYTLSTAWNLSTTTYVSGVQLSSHQGYITGVSWDHNNGQYFYITGSTPDSVDRYEICGGGHYKLFGRP